jgi:hypothetical protein
MIPRLVSPSENPTPRMCPKLIVAISVARSNLPKPVGISLGEVDRLSRDLAATMAIATELQIIITKAVFSPHGSV